MKVDFEKAGEVLRSGSPLVFETDTVCGLGIAVHHAESPKALFELKGRDSAKPVAWLVDSPDALDAFGKEVPEYARGLAREGWPGALTLVVRASDAVPEAFAGRMVDGTRTIGLRMPAHDGVLRLIHAIGSPIAATSANLSGKPAPASLAEVDQMLLERVPYCTLSPSEEARHGTASTVIDCTGVEPRKLR